MQPELNRTGRPSASRVDAGLGSLLSWVTGKRSLGRGHTPLDGALGELLSWVTGKDDRHRPAR